MRRIATVLALALLLSACGGGGDGGSNPPPAPGLVAGNNSDKAADQLTHVDGPATAPDDIIGGVLLDRIVVALAPAATVAEVNAAARVIGALSIVSAEPDSLLIVIEVPRQPNVAAVGALAAQLRTQPGIVDAWPGRTAKTSVLPESQPLQPVPPSDLAQLLGERFPEAWNARGAAPTDCLQRVVDVYVWDEFGDPVPNDFFLQIDRSSFADDPNYRPQGDEVHGYEVTSVLAARFDADTPTGGDPFPDCVLVHQVQTAGLDMLHSIRHLMDLIEQDPTPRVVVNSSIVFTDDVCGANGDLPCDATTLPNTTEDSLKLAVAHRMVDAGEWANRARAAGFADKVLMVQAAGNIDAPDEPDNPPGLLPKAYPGFRSALFASPAALATGIDTLQTLATEPALWQPSGAIGNGLPDLTFDATEFGNTVLQQLPDLTPGNGLSAANLLLVGSVGPLANTTGEIADDLRRSSFSFGGADVGAVGEGVVLSTRQVDGTSFSAPEVAGLAAFLWNVSPALQAQPVGATADLIKRSSRLAASSPVLPIVDAYAAVLQLDDVPGCCGGSQFAPIRLALMDADRNERFGAADLQEFSDAFHLTDPNAPEIPTQRDFSRFDLNGDGYTGGIAIASFDLDVNGLDANGLPNINATDMEIEGYQVTFNEAALSDVQVLCYYAYSPLYATDQGGPNDQARTQLLGPDHCVGARVNTLFPAQIDTTTNLTITVEVPAGNRQFSPAPNLLVQLTPSCATVNPASGRTDANGQLTATVTPDAGCASLSVDLIARADPNTTPLAQQRVTATIPTTSRLAGLLTYTADIAPSPGTDEVHEQVSALVSAEVRADGTIAILSASGDVSFVRHNHPFDSGSCGTLQFTDTTTGSITGGSYPGFSSAAAGTLTLTGNLVFTFEDVLDDCSPRTNTSTGTDVPVKILNGTHVFQGSRLVAIDFNHTEEVTPDNPTHVVITGRLEPPP